jgi:putative ATP-binding cassette transporter
LLIACVAAAVGNAAIHGWFVSVTKNLWDAVQHRDKAAFWYALLLNVTGLGGTALAIVLLAYFRQGLEIRWRQGMTEYFTGRWLSDNAFYRIARDKLIDNPDQRISEDVRGYVRSVLTLGLDFITTVGSLCIYMWMLWHNSGPMSLTIGTYDLHIPGFLFWLAIAWAAIQNGITHWSGHKLAGITVRQQKAEADLRFALMQAHESAEQIALYRGADVERQRLSRTFHPVYTTWREMMTQFVRLNSAMIVLPRLGNWLPMIALSPMIFAGEVSYGTLYQSILTFSMAVDSMIWFVHKYPELFDLSAMVRRLGGLLDAASQPTQTGIAVVSTTGSTMRCNGLLLARPNGSVLTQLGALQFPSGTRCVVRGPSGVGKSTLLRAIAGLWPHGCGQVYVPHAARLMILPQISYMPNGTLKEALTYPLASDSVSDEACQKVLADCMLSSLEPYLHESDRWVHRLSPGEQQRLALARALLYKPDILFLDESTSALDNDAEHKLYTLLIERLPDATLVSVAHRTTLDAFHMSQLTVCAANDGVVTGGCPPSGLGGLVSRTVSIGLPAK